MTSPSPFTESERDLQKLLDLSKIETLSKIAERFRHIAQTLLYDYRLCVECDGAMTEFQLLEIEFYLYSAGIHEDPFCHAHNGQSIPGQWYFDFLFRACADYYFIGISTVLAKQMSSLIPVLEDIEVALGKVLTLLLEPLSNRPSSLRGHLLTQIAFVEAFYLGP